MDQLPWHRLRLAPYILIFFNEHNAPKKLGFFDKKQNKFIYWRDEPQVLQVFYESALLSIFIFNIFNIICNKAFHIWNQNKKVILILLSRFLQD